VATNLSLFQDVQGPKEPKPRAKTVVRPDTSSHGAGRLTLENLRKEQKVVEKKKEVVVEEKAPPCAAPWCEAERSGLYSFCFQHQSMLDHSAQSVLAYAKRPDAKKGALERAEQVAIRIIAVRECRSEADQKPFQESPEVLARITAVLIAAGFRRNDKDNGWELDVSLYGGKKVQPTAWAKRKAAGGGPIPWPDDIHVDPAEYEKAAIARERIRVSGHGDAPAPALTAATVQRSTLQTPVAVERQSAEDFRRASAMRLWSVRALASVQGATRSAERKRQDLKRRIALAVADDSGNLVDQETGEILAGPDSQDGIRAQRDAEAAEAERLREERRRINQADHRKEEARRLRRERRDRAQWPELTPELCAAEAARIERLLAKRGAKP
jgi:hypothetical protein